MPNGLVRMIVHHVLPNVIADELVGGLAPELDRLNTFFFEIEWKELC